MGTVFPGTYIPTGIGSASAYNTLIDGYLTPRLMSFRQIHIHDEPADLSPEDRLTWSVTWGNWLQDAPLRVRKNGQLLASGGLSSIDYVHGTFKAGAVSTSADLKPKDTVEVTYWFDYFTCPVLEAFYNAAVQIVNATAVGSNTFYTVTTAPISWYGVLTDLAFAQCMEKMLLDYDLWRYRLLFAIGPNEVETGGGDIVNQLQTLKTNAEERANKTMDNEKFKCGNYLSAPTATYYNSIRGYGGGTHGIPFLTGRLHGWKPNQWYLS